MRMRQRWTVLAWVVAVVGGGERRAQVGFEEAALARLENVVRVVPFANDWECHFAVIERAAEGGTSVRLDGRLLGRHAGVVPESLRFGPRGDRLAYVAFDADRWRVVLDGKEGADWDFIEGGSALFSPDGNRLAYVARRGAKYRAVVDG